MKRSYQQIIGAFLLGLWIPGVLLHLGASIADYETRMDEGAELPTGETQSQVMETTPETEDHMILVCMGEGQTQMMELEEYLLGVVLAEMPASFEDVALQAQATVARTYALKRQQKRDHHEDGAICTDYRCCQAYISVSDYLNGMGTQEDVDRVAMAVVETAGSAVTYEGEIIEATYFSCSGGRTEDAAAVWGAAYPYLKSVDSPGEENADHFVDTVRFSLAQLESALGQDLSDHSERWIDWCTYTMGGGVDKLCIGGKIYTGIQLRQMLGLRSTMFTVAAVDGGIEITTYGSGHRVGMSQWGAEAMAAQGCSMEEILGHYYPGCKVEKVFCDN